MNQNGRYKAAGLKIINKTKRLLALPLKLFRLKRIYLLISLGTLFLSTIFWAILAAKLNNYNADQLANAYLFQDTNSFHQASLPAAHTFLVKWPLFFLMSLFGVNSATLIIFTVGITLATVAIFAAILAYIERRPAVLATLYLALASVLLFVPPVPAPGTLLPLNMAMLTTRNLEYVIYLGALLLLIKNYRFKSWQFWTALSLLTLLGASDKLFLYLSLGGALGALIFYGLTSGWNLVSFSAKWVTLSLGAIAASSGLLWLVEKLGVVNIASQQLGPYGLINSLHKITLGVVYGVVGLFSNMGANAAFDTTILKEMPGRAVHNLFLFGVIGFVVNLIVLTAGIYACFVLIKLSLIHNKSRDSRLESGSMLALAAIWSGLAAFVLFIATDHYYAADGRYLGLATFSLFIAIAAVARTRQWSAHNLLVMGELILLGIMLAIPGVIHSYHNDQDVFQPQKTSDAVIVEALTKHKVDYLVGDYWRVLPAKFDAPATLPQIMPLQNCTAARQTITTAKWQPDLRKHSFAYLLASGTSLTDFPSCKLGDIVKKYGRPNSSVLLAGSYDHPLETMLFYDKGIRQSSPTTPAPAQGPATVVPITIDQLPHTYCPVPTIMNVVAHQDDDLLFMNPDLLHDIRAGHCVRTVYVTAGDAGGAKFYWLGRQQGSEAAYSKMLGGSDIWVERILKIGENEYVTVANPRGNEKISLIFMYLPDGNLKGQGFPLSKNESLERLGANSISSIESIYAGSSYSPSQLSLTLTTLMHTYLPTEIRTQSDFAGSTYPDHSDHRAVGRFTKTAYQNYIQQRFEGRPEVPIKFYLGYSGHERPANVSGEDLVAKESAFLEYSKHDVGVCQSDMRCRRDPAYGAYLVRQYTNDY